MASTSSAIAPPETRLRYSVATALASTSFSPTFSRVRNVDGLLCWRERSKNSSMLAVWPTVTISEAPWWSAQQQRQVGGRSGGGERHRADAEVLDALQPCGVAVGVGGQHHLGAALAAPRC